MKDRRLARFGSGPHMQRNKKKDTAWFPECTTFQDYEDVIGIGWIHIKMTEKSEQNKKVDNLLTGTVKNLNIPKEVLLFNFLSRQMKKMASQSNDRNPQTPTSILISRWNIQMAT
ncbi:unnamed protein product [Caenorhabditis nigoni]